MTRLLSCDSGGSPRLFRRAGRILSGVLAGAFGLVGTSVPVLATEVPLIKHTIDGSVIGPSSIHAADLDGDGDLDVVAPAQDPGVIAWWENDGASPPGFTKHIIDDSYDAASSAIAADVDGDGDLDIIGAAAFDGITWWESNGASPPSFSKHSIPGSTFGTWSVHAADVDGDGDIDILSAALIDPITWWENDGASPPNFTEHVIDQMFGSASSVFAADVDGDGDTDVLGATSAGDHIIWWENDGASPPTFVMHTVDGSFNGATSVFGSDVDGDGDIDILGAALNDNEIAWWENDGSSPPSFTKRTITSSMPQARAVHASDLDGDGDIDVLGTSFNNHEVAWWESDGASPPVFTKHTIDALFGSSRSVITADLDGDGDRDVLAASFHGLAIAWWENDTIHRNAVFPVEHVVDGAFNKSVYAADVDGDGDLDVLGAHLYRDDIAWWENTGGNVKLWTRHIVDSDFNYPVSVYTADVDGDGDVDVLGAAAGADEIAWWENTTRDGTAWTKHTVDGNFDNALSVYAADVDGDGDVDVLGAAYFADEVAWWENTAGDGTAWTQHTVHADFDGSGSVFAADMDGDGDVDVLGAGYSADDIAWWENTARDGTAWTEHTVDGDVDGPTSVHAADVDGDGDLDVLGAALVTDDIAWWENTAGDGTAWTKHTVDANSDDTVSVYAADVDGDGDGDLLGAVSGANDIVWWENMDGDGTAWIKHTIDADFYGPTSVYAADVDGDGDLDILGAADYASDIAWWENRGGQFGLPTMETAAPLVQAGALSEVLKITATHNGRTGDNPGELVTLELLLEETAGDPLSDGEANGLLDSLRIYLDEPGAGAGSFQQADDTEVASISAFSLTDGVQTVSFTDGDMDVELVFGTDRCYFVVVEPALGSALPGLRITHQTESTSTGEDADFDIPLRLAFTPNRTASITVNEPPVADAGPDQLLQVPGGGTADVTLDGSASMDPDGDMLTYAWTGPFPEGGGTVMGVMPMVTLGPGLHTITLTVDDGNGGTAMDTVDIDVNQLPVADAGPDQLLQIPGGGTADVTLDGSGSSDPDMDMLTYTWTGPFPEGSGTVMGVMPMVTLGPGLHTITLTVDDGNGGTAMDMVDVDVNQVPVANAGPDQLLQIPGGGTADVTLDGSGSSDADMDAFTYTWTGPFPEGSGTVMGVMPMVTLGPGLHTITLTVDDGSGGMAMDTVDIEVNQLPVADAGANQDFSAPSPGGVPVTLDGSGSFDPDGDPLTYSWSGPFGSASGVSPTVQIPGGVHTVTLTVNDGRGGVDSDTTTITVTTLAVSPSALTFTIAKGAATDSQPFTVEALGGTVSYSIAQTATWLRANPASGQSSGEKDTIQAMADASGLAAGTYLGSLVVNGPGVIKESVQVTLIVTGDGPGGGPPTPKPFANGVVDAADFIPFGEPGHAVALQSVVSIFGEDFVTEGEFTAESIPLPTMLGGVMVSFDGIKAGLFLVSPGLIIAQMPAGVTLPTATMVITNGGAKAASEPFEIQVAEYSPGIFTLSQDGEGQAIVVHAGTADLAAPVGTSGNSRPATEGDNLTIYANGMGAVDPPIEDGHNSCDPDGVCLPDGSNVVLHHTLTKPVIRIGGMVVPDENVLFSGASPGSVGVNEVVFTVPPGMPTGDAVSLTIEIGGIVSSETTMALE